MFHQPFTANSLFDSKYRKKYNEIKSQFCWLSRIRVTAVLQKWHGLRLKYVRISDHTVEAGQKIWHLLLSGNNQSIDLFSRLNSIWLWSVYRLGGRLYRVCKSFDLMIMWRCMQTSLGDLNLKQLVLWLDQSMTLRLWGSEYFVTHCEQWAVEFVLCITHHQWSKWAAHRGAPGGKSGVRCLAQGHISVVCRDWDYKMPTLLSQAGFPKPLDHGCPSTLTVQSNVTNKIWIKTMNNMKKQLFHPF